MPAAQLVQARQVRLVGVLNWPMTQLAQTVFVVGVPAVAWVEPAWHTVHGLQLGAFSVDENIMLPQSAQVRFVVALPALSTYLPVTHVVRFTHGVAGEASSSQVPAGQVTGGFAPPLHEVPAAHGVQPGGVVLVAGVVS